MIRVLITGMSGTGKSSLVRELARLGYRAVDADDPGWSEMRAMPGALGERPEMDWVWREDRIEELLSTEAGGPLFLSGCAQNQGTFYPRFDHIVLLSAPVPVLLHRLATRTTNDYGKRPEEVALVLNHLETVEPRLRRVATLEVDTSAPLDQVLATVLKLVKKDDVQSSAIGLHGRDIIGA